METRIADLLAGLLLGGANAFSATALVLAALCGLGCIAAQLHSIGLPHIQTCGIGASHVAR
jgi:hypothetical protein